MTLRLESSPSDHSNFAIEARALIALEYATKYPAYASHDLDRDCPRDISPATARAIEAHWDESASPERKAVMDVMEESLRHVSDEELSQLAPSERFIRNHVRSGPQAG